MNASGCDFECCVDTHGCTLYGGSDTTTSLFCKIGITIFCMLVLKRSPSKLSKQASNTVIG